MGATTKNQTQDLAVNIKQARAGEKPIETALSTSDRVLRRVTDGIYREPWSALRELVSNAYDADATEVTIDTDAPRFERVIIRDNGMGFTAEALAAMIKNIGGSPKRTSTGVTIGITDPDDSSKSPSGRKLIGKLGIGLFAVSQLTHEFQVITKRRGENTRTVADVLLFRYAEEKGKTPQSDELEYRTGSVRIWKVPAHDKKAQGTEIILRNLLPRTKAELASQKMWTQILSHEQVQHEDQEETRQRPTYHIGCIDQSQSGEYLEQPALPWGNETDPDARFQLFANGMFDQVNNASDPRPSLDNTFDNYLKFLWYLSLAAPLDYLQGHPFDISDSSELRVFKLGNTKGARAEQLDLKEGQTIREALGLKAPERGSNFQFKVVVDGVSLKRPLRFAGLPKSSHSVDRPLLFIGHDLPDLSKYPESIRGGELEFEGYLLWSPRVVPVEHNGVLLRINDASGTLFDSTFMDYRVSEQTRLRQVSAEIFVTKGLDAALNIDRESFNVAHPHFQYLSSWVHNAFKQFATRHKDIASKALTRQRANKRDQETRELVEVVTDIVDSWSGGDEQPVKVEFASTSQLSLDKRAKDTIVYSLEDVFAKYDHGQRRSANKDVEFELDKAVMRGVTQVLYAAGVFDKMSHEKQERLLADLAKVIFHRRSS